MNSINCILLVLLTVIFARAEDLAVAPRDNWRPASVAQSTLLQKQPGIQVLDFSLKDVGGVGFVLKSILDSNVHPETVDQVVSGYVQSITAAGNTDITRTPFRLGVLPGVRVDSNGHPKQGDTKNVSFLLFAERAVYTITVLGLPGVQDSAKLQNDYLARIAVPENIKAGSTDPNSGFERGRRFGLIIGKHEWLVLAGISLLALAVIVVRKTRKKRPRRFYPTVVPETLNAYSVFVRSA